MKISLALTSILSATTLVSALPPQQHAESRSLSHGLPVDSFDASLSNQLEAQHLESRDLEKRRGGGGGKGGGSSGGGKGGSGSSSSGGRSASSYSFSSSSNTGGRTRDGSGSAPAYGGRYSGGAAVPYTAGARSPTRGFVPFLLPITALAFFPALWLYPVYAYPYGGYGGYHWLDNNGRNRTANVTCLCQEYSVCGCDQGGNDTVTAQQLTNGTGTGAPVNTTSVKVVDFGDGNTTAYINGTLDNGTTASGGTDPSNESQISAAVQLLVNYGGYWMAALVASLFLTVA